MSTVQNKRKRASYPSDMSKNGWKQLKKILPRARSGASKGGRPAVDLKEVINAIFYVLKTGCSWRSLHRWREVPPRAGYPLGFTRLYCVSVGLEPD